MHMADALVSPAVGGTLLAVSGGLVGLAARRLGREMDDAKVPLMGVLGAFIFAVQMVNFTIPGTGSSGHLGGGILLAVLLGPHAAFLTMASILTVQALFFGDGGLLAAGCNVFNLGFVPCFLGLPFVFRRIAGDRPTRGRLVAASIVAAVLGLELGALGVVVQTTLSGVSDLPFGPFALLMLTIHLPIGLVEGLVTAAVVTFVWRARPELVTPAAAQGPRDRRRLRAVLAVFLALAVVAGGALSWLASTNPDGLEWSVERAADGGGEAPAAAQGGVRGLLARVQAATSLFPDYDFPGREAEATTDAADAAGPGAGTTLSGLVGAAVVLVVVGLVGLGLRHRSRRREATPGPRPDCPAP